MAILTAEQQEYSMNAIESTHEPCSQELAGDDTFAKDKAAILEAIGCVSERNISSGTDSETVST